MHQIAPRSSVYRKEARHARERAADTFIEDHKRGWLDVAESYDKLAEIAEKYEQERPF